MKLRNYFLLSIVVGAAVACSSNEDIPEEHVFTPNATLSLATGVYGDGRTKAVGIDVTEEEKKENKKKRGYCEKYVPISSLSYIFNVRVYLKCSL